MKTDPTIRWMCLFSTKTGERPAWLPSNAVAIRLDGGCPAAPAAVVDPSDELNGWPGGERGNTP